MVFLVRCHRDLFSATVVTLAATKFGYGLNLDQLGRQHQGVKLSLTDSVSQTILFDLASIKQHHTFAFLLIRLGEDPVADSVISDMVT